MQVACLSTIVYGVVHPYRFDVEVDPDLDQTFHFDADLDPDPDPTPRFIRGGASEILFCLLFTAVPAYIEKIPSLPVPLSIPLSVHF
jgi:hypothetical protein